MTERGDNVRVVGEEPEPETHAQGAESKRLADDDTRESNWKRWGPYLSERQWGTVREDYSANGDTWGYFPHDHARSRTYRWGEDGLLGVCDRQGRLCFGLALWNGNDPILKERLYGLTNPEGNHGEDCKELYYYLDATPTHSYLKALYKYPQRAYPYQTLREESARRGRHEPELEVLDTLAFSDDRYFDVQVEYAKAAPEDLLIRITIENCGPDAARLDVLPTLWFRNTWRWGRTGEGYAPEPRITRTGPGRAHAEHATLGHYEWICESHEPSVGDSPPLLFTNNETNKERLYGVPSDTKWVKDAFHDYVVRGRHDAVCPQGRGTKCAAHYQLDIPGRGKVVLRARLRATSMASDQLEPAFGAPFEAVFEARRAEADAFYAERIPEARSAEERLVARQAYAGLLWSKQFYYYVVREWLEGDPSQPAPPRERLQGRNLQWRQAHNRDVISMPDKWEYPWYAAWDLAFHMVPFARIDPRFAKDQLTLFLREWYMHPNGQIPAYEFNFGDVNPPVHAWAALRVYRATGSADRTFLARIFQKLLINFTWWVNRKDEQGNNLFNGGFLGLDNIGVFDRSKKLPEGASYEQADGTAWMAFYCTTMLQMACVLAREDPVYEDVASKFFEHFVSIVDAIQGHGGTGLWDEEDGFYYDKLLVGGRHARMRVRSMVGLVPLFASMVLEDANVDELPGFRRRLSWFLENRLDLAVHTDRIEKGNGRGGRRLLSIASRDRLVRVLSRVLDEREFLSPYGIRSLSRAHADEPFEFTIGGETHRVAYVPGESDSGMFGGNSNWRGPIWLPMNYLLTETLRRFHRFYGDTLKVECPTRSGNFLTLDQVADEIERRLVRLFVADADGKRACHGHEPRYASDPRFQELVLFYEHFHGDSGRGVGATHQTGWTALVAEILSRS